MNKVEFVNSIDQDEVAHNDPPHLDLHCLSSEFSKWCSLDKFFKNFDVVILLAGPRSAIGRVPDS